MPSVTEINSVSEFDAVIKEAKPTVVDFYASWCGPCKAIAPRLEDLAVKTPTVKFIKVDTDRLSALAQRYNVTAMPTFHFYANGKKCDEVIGADLESIKRIVFKISSSAPSSFGGKGYVLGSGKEVSGTSSANSFSNSINWNLIWVVLIGFLVYKWYNNSA